MTTSNTTPAERLSLSRERLRAAMSRPPVAPGAAFSTAPHRRGVGAFDLLKLVVPSASLLIDTLEQWWAGHRLQSGGQMAGQVAGEVLRPLARRHPVALVAGAAALGALLIWSRPWRWLLKPQLFNAVGPVILSSVLASGALQAWLQNLLAKTQAPPESPAPQTGTSPPKEYAG